MRVITAALVVAGALLMFGAVPDAAQQAGYARRPFAPVDEGRNDPSWTAFRDRLLDAVRLRDRSFLLGIVDPDIRNSFSEPNGPDAFHQTWGLHDPSSSPLWKVLEEILTLGGTFTAPNIFCAPYVYTRFLLDGSTADHEAVIRQDVPVFAQPTKDSRVVATLSFELVRTAPSDAPERVEGRGWVFVRLPNGQSGYVEKINIRSPLDYRACFSRTGNTWRMTMLLAGD